MTSGVISGICAGFTSTLCQAGGPPFQIYVLAQKVTKMNFVGTTAFFFAAVNALKVVPYFALGQFSHNGLATSALLLPFAMATNHARLLGGAHHAAGAVLQDHHGVDGADLDRADPRRRHGDLAQLNLLTLPRD